jgi:hypothetical protein
MFARGPIAPHPEHVTTTNCVCPEPNVATLKLSLAQKGQGRRLIVGIRDSAGDDKRQPRKVLAAAVVGPTDGRNDRCAVVDVGNRPSCTSFECYSTVHSYGMPMRFAVRFLRHRGRIIPWREVVNQEPRVVRCVQRGLLRKAAGAARRARDGDELPSVHARRLRTRCGRRVRAVVARDGLIIRTIVVRWASLDPIDGAAHIFG